MPNLPPGSSSDSSIQHQPYDSSTSSGSGLPGNDCMMEAGRVIDAWDAGQGPTPGGDGQVKYQEVVANPTMSSVAFPAPTFSLPGLPQIQPSLRISRILEKSRVETQIPVVLTLHAMPEVFKKIHFPPSCISKSKLLARVPPAKSPDTLELQVALVCTSAMLDPAKRKLALDREIGLREQVGGGCNNEEKPNPLDGGEVDACTKCIKRERKRANRKKVKNIEEEVAWQRDEGKRIIVFNNQEVIDVPEQAATTENAEGTGNGCGPGYRAYPTCSKFVNIKLAMRITCYCRHHEEKYGFQ